MLEAPKPSLSMLAVRVNAICFTVGGLALYLINYALNDSHRESPLGYEGIDGIYLSIGGGVAGYFFCRYRFLPPLRIAPVSVGVIFLWFFGLFVLTSLTWNLGGPLDADHLLVVWSVR